MASSAGVAEQVAGKAEQSEVEYIARRVGQLSEPNRARLFEALANDVQRNAFKSRSALNGAGMAQESIQSAGTASWAGGSSQRSEELTLANIDEAMRYQPWDGYQMDCGDQVREALTAAAKVILRLVPAGRFRSVALRHILDARMQANAAISFRGRF